MCLVLVTVIERRKLRWIEMTLLLDPMMLIQNGGLTVYIASALPISPHSYLRSDTFTSHEEDTEAKYRNYTESYD